MTSQKRVFAVIREEDSGLESLKEVVGVYESYNDAYDYVKKMDSKSTIYRYKIRSASFFERR